MINNGSKGNVTVFTDIIGNVGIESTEVLQRKRHTHDLEQDGDADMIVFKTVEVKEISRSIPYPLLLLINYEVTSTHGEIFPIGVYAWYKR